MRWKPVLLKLLFLCICTGLVLFNDLDKMILHMHILGLLFLTNLILSGFLFFETFLPNIKLFSVVLLAVLLLWLLWLFGISPIFLLMFIFWKDC